MSATSVLYVAVGILAIYKIPFPDLCDSFNNCKTSYFSCITYYRYFPVLSGNVSRMVSTLFNQCLLKLVS